MPTISFNGKTYNSIEEMPAKERQIYSQIAEMLVDKDGNGIPDFLEGDVVKNVVNVFKKSVDVNGQSYSDIDQLPPDVRVKIQGAFEKMAEFGIVKEALSARVNQGAVMSSRPIVTPQSSIQEERSSPLMWLLIGVGLTLCLALAVAAAFFLFTR